MKTHRRILHVAIPARTIPVEALRGALGSDPMVRAARGILILALALGSLGSLGTDATASAGPGGADHPSGPPRPRDNRPPRRPSPPTSRATTSPRPRAIPR